MYLSALGRATEARARCLKRNFLREKLERALAFIYQGNKGKVDFAASSPFSENGFYTFRGRSLQFRLAAGSRELFASKIPMDRKREGTAAEETYRYRAPS